MQRPADGESGGRPCRSRVITTRLVVLIVLLSHVGLLAWSGWCHSPGWDEPKHVLAGISHWEYQRFDLYRVNPPLVRMVGVLPLLLTDYKTDWRRFDARAGARSEVGIRDDFLAANGKRSFWLHTLARWGCIPLSLIGAYVCFRWTHQLYGPESALLAVVLWCFSPNILANGAMITSEVGAAALGGAAAYAFWTWLRGPNWSRTIIAGVGLGLAELTKTTWIVLFGLWPCLWAVWLVVRCKRKATEDETGKAREGNGSPTTVRSEMAQLAVILLLGLYLINVGYGFEGSFQRLGDFGFVSQLFGGPKHDDALRLEVRNRFQGTWMASAPVPLPKNYVMGIDLQKWDFERKMFSYLHGEWRMGGWWYYYLYALAIKVPLGTWGLVVLALLLGLFRRGYSATCRDELVLLAPAVVVLALVSSQTGFNHHLRYVLPIFPFGFIWMSKVARVAEFRHWKLTAVVIVATVWSVGSSLCVYPHSLSYFNELVGGPAGGHAHLLNSNIDWGQDLLYLKGWLDKHPRAKPLHLAYSSCYDASLAGIEYRLPPSEPEPGWHAVSVNQIHNRSGVYEYFLHFKPVGMAGYSIYIYHITPAEANRVRRELGMRELPADWQPPGGGDHG